MAGILTDGNYTSDIQSGVHGDRFQKDVALVLFLRMRKNPLKPNVQLRLGYEVKEAGKFDDVVLIDDENEVIHFVQMKHGSSKDGKVNPIDVGGLFPARKGNEKCKGDFDMGKYLESYIVVQHDFKGSAYKKKFYILTNKNLNLTDNKDRVIIKEQEDMPEILQFGKPKRPPLELVPNQTTTEELISHVNKDFNGYIQAIKNLFFDGKVSEPLRKYCTPTQEDVLEIDKNKQCKFKKTFSSKSEQLSVKHVHDALDKENFNMTSQVKVEINFLQKDSRFKCLPPYANEAIAKAFFRDFSLLVGQPDDLRSLIDNELRKWLRGWVRPDVLGKITQSDMDQLYSSLENSFVECNKPKVESRQGSSRDEMPEKKKKKLEENDKRPLLKMEDVEECLKIIRNNNKKFEPEDPTELNEFYINRKIIYKEKIERPADENTGQGDVEFDGTSVRPIVAVDIDETNQIQTQILDRSIGDIQFAEELRGKFKDQQCIVLVADPGMGKTSLLKFVAFEAQKKHDFNVFLVYFNGLIRALNKVKEITDFDGMIEILQTVLSKENCDIIRNARDQRDGKGFSILLVLDGFDEIHARYTEKVKSMLKLLQAIPSIQMVISSRMHTQKLLENEFDVQSMFIEPFSKENQIEYLKKRWNVSNDADHCVKEYLEKLLENFQSSIPSNLANVCSLPLMMRMLADIRYDDFEQYNNNRDQPYDFDKLSIVQLYERFIRKGLHHKYVEKSGGYFVETDLDTMIEGHIFEHQLLALKLLHIEIDENLFKNSQYVRNYKSFLRRCLEESEKSPLVKVVEDTVQFCHLSYGEYFVAKYICDNIYSLKEDRVVRVLSEHDVIRKLAFYMLDRDDQSFEQVKNLCKLDLHIALWACEGGSYKMISSLKEHLKVCSFFDLDLMLRSSAEGGCVKICELLLKHEANPNGFDEMQQAPLHFAARNSHVTVVQLLLERGADVNAKSDNKRTPLHMAAEEGTVQVIKELIKEGAITNSCTRDGDTPLHSAALKGNKNVVEYFLNQTNDQNATNNNQNATNNKKCTPLHLAARNGHVSVVRSLIQHGANIDALNEDESSALHMAAEGGNVQVIQVLIDIGKITNSRTKTGRTPLHVAVMNGNKDAVEFFLSYYKDVNSMDNDQSTALHFAAKEGNIQIIQSLIEDGAIIDSRTNCGSTPLHFAAKHGHGKAVELLISQKKGVNIVDKDGWTALHMAAKAGNVQIIHSFIEAGAITNSRTKNGRTPLHIAAMYGNKDAAELFIGPNNNVNSVDGQKYTALHLAAREGHISVVELLLNRGAEVDTRNEFGNTALQLAAHRGHVQVMQLLIKAEADISIRTNDEDTPFLIASEYGRTDAVEYLISRNTDMNVKDKRQCTALHLAVSSGMCSTVEALLNHQCIEVDARNLDGETALHMAAKKGDVRVIKSLILAGADPHARTNDGKTCLHIAAKKGRRDASELFITHKNDVDAVDNEKSATLHLAIEFQRPSILDNVDVVELLLKHHANANAANKDGWTALHMAAWHGNVRMIQLLINGRENAHGENVTVSGRFLKTLVKAKEHFLNQDRQKPTLRSAGYHGGLTMNEILIHHFAEEQALDRDEPSTLQESTAERNVPEIQPPIRAPTITNPRTNNGRTPLHIAAMMGRVKVSKVLIDNNNDVNAVDNEEHTALHLAAGNDNVNVVKLLLRHRANVDVRDGNGKTALDLATEESHDRVIQLLESVNETHFQVAVEQGAEEKDDNVKRLFWSRGGLRFYKSLGDRAHSSPE